MSRPDNAKPPTPEREGFPTDSEEPTGISGTGPALPLDFDDNPQEITSVNSARSPDLVPAARDRHLLVRLRGAAAGEVTRLAEMPCRVGRAVDSFLVVTDEGVSRKHALLIPNGDSYLLVDTDSANGTFVMGERVVQRVLRDGDIVQLGPKAAFRYTLTDGPHEELLRKLFQTSITDALTGARKREYFDNRLLAELSYAKRHNTALALILLDIDHFKLVNDRYGHTTGDQVLVHLGALILNELREEDVFARYGGEEFAIITPGVGLEGCRVLAERLRALLEATEIDGPEGPFRVTLSAGCATARELPDASPESLVKTADERLYAAKRLGRNRVVSESTPAG